MESGHTSDRPSANGAPRAERVAALHHVTGIAGDARANHRFYAGALGLRLVKRTVNFDDPTTYHLYYGDAVGAPGSAITFFPWQRLAAGRVGLGQATLTQYAAPEGSLAAWKARLEAAGAEVLAEEDAFGESRLIALDPDGAPIAITEAPNDPRAAGPTRWTEAAPNAIALHGFHGVTLAVADAAPMARILTEVFDYAPAGEEAAPGGRRLRFRGADAAGVVDLHVAPKLARGVEGVGVTHHVAFSTPNRETQAAVRARVAAAGLAVTPPIDRDYFWAIYFRTPSGVLFEVATDAPGFERDETRETLGSALKLPTRYEPHRAEIEAALPPLDGA